jgi:hypothetical protein
MPGKEKIDTVIIKWREANKRGLLELGPGNIYWASGHAEAPSFEQCGIKTRRPPTGILSHCSGKKITFWQLSID